MTKDGLPETLEELCDYIVEWADDIFIRFQKDGKWDAYALSDIPAKDALAKAMAFIKEGRIPVRVCRDGACSCTQDTSDT